MRLWPALLLAPLAALAAISGGYAAVPAACGARWEWLMHLAFIVPLGVSLGATAMAAARLAGDRDRFLPLVATGTGSFFSLVIAAAWGTTLLLSPCTP